MKKTTLTMLLAGALMASCSSGGGDDAPSTPETPVTPETPTKRPINISTSIAATRATDYGFESGDKIGLYVVNHAADGTATLLNTGNYVDNMRFVYNGSWTPDTPIYWKDNATRADFYLYYPYSAAVSNVKAIPFTAKADQSTEAAYKASDLMAGSTQRVAPTDEAVSIEASHLLSQAVITVGAGNGFTAASLAASSIGVKINGVKTACTFDLTDRSTTATGTATDVTPYCTSNTWKALIVPQTTTGGELITVTVDGREFKLRKAFTFEGGKRHAFTVVVSKTSNGINVNINPWEDDGTDNGGTAE